jgi:hypothetical protein
MTGALLWLTGRWFGWVVILPMVAIELAMGNVHVFIAAAIVAGFRYPGLWTLMFITKVTPGIPVVWFAFRREWRALAIALGTTAIVVGVSFVLAPQLWRDWSQMLLNLNEKPAAPATPLDLVPRPIRWAVAIGLVAWGARSNRRWVVPIAVVLCLPMAYVNGLTILVAAPVLWARDRTAKRVVPGPSDAVDRRPEWLRRASSTDAGEIPVGTS